MNTSIKKIRQEQMFERLRAELPDVQLSALKAAQERGDAEEAAAVARKIRNRLLDESDKQVTLDRLTLDTSTAAGFIMSLKDILSGAWTRYRQELRDITDIEGFPLSFEFPTSPDETEEIN